MIADMCLCVCEYKLTEPNVLKKSWFFVILHKSLIGA